RASAGGASSSGTGRGPRSPAAGRRPEGRHGSASEGRVSEDVGAHGLVALGFLRLAAGAAHDARGALLRRAEWALAPARCLVVAAHLLLHPRLFRRFGVTDWPARRASLSATASACFRDVMRWPELERS